MKFKIEKSNLSEALKLPIQASAPKGPMPVLGSVLITAGDGIVEITGTNLDQQIASFCEAEVESPGSVCVPASRFRNIVSAVSGSIEIEADGDDICFKSGKFSSTLMGLPVEEFPSLKKEDMNFNCSFPGDLLAAKIHSCIFAASTDETRYALNGVLLESTKEGTRMVATDGRRLAMVDLGRSYGEFAVIIPSIAAAAIESAARDAGSVELVISDSTLECTTEMAVVHTKLIEGKYPDYRAVIPSRDQKWATAEFDKKGLISAFKRVGLFSDKARPATMLSFAGGTLTLDSSINGEGQAKEEVEGAGDDFETCVNPQYVDQMLNSVDEDEIEIWSKDKESPIRIHVGDLEYIVMPMRQG